MASYTVRSPALPIQPEQYNRSQMDQFQSVLRLYFNRLDDFNIKASTQQNSQNVLMWLGNS
jgi:hypothetical protein